MEEKLAENYEKLEQDVEKIPEILAARSSKELTRHLVGLEKQLVLLYCCRCLEEMMEDRFSPAAVPGTLLSGDRGVFGRHVSLQPSVTG